jgi:hypothetical protein
MGERREKGGEGEGRGGSGERREGMRASARMPHVHADVFLRPRRRIFTASADGKTRP